MIFKSGYFITSLVLISQLFSGCAAKNFNEPGVEDYEELNTTEVFNVNQKMAWTAVFNVMSHYPIVYSSEENLEIQTDWIKGKSERLFSQYDENRVPYVIRFRLYVKMRKIEANKTKIVVQNNEQYQTDLVTSGGDFTKSLYEWIDTESTTYKENAVLKKVEIELLKMLQQKKPKSKRH